MGILGILEGSSAVARAEILDSAKLHLNQSTAFGATWLPAGEYRISLAHSHASPPTLVVENLDTRTSIFVPAARVESHITEAPEHTGIVLRHTDGRFYVTSVWFEGQSTGYSVLSGSLQPQAPAPQAEMLK